MIPSYAKSLLGVYAKKMRDVIIILRDIRGFTEKKG